MNKRKQVRTLVRSVGSATLSLLLLVSEADASNSGVSYQGRILKPDGTPLSGVTTQFRIQIRTPDSQNCLLYEEVHVQDLSDSNGSFAITINDGNGTRTDSTALTLDRLFSNRGSMTLPIATCTTGPGVYSPNPADGRNLVVSFKDETMSTWEPIPAQKINYVPFAFESKQVQGFGADSLVRVVNGSGNPVTGLSPLSNTQYTELLALVNGTSAAFAKAGELGGVALPTLGVAQAGQMLSWTGTGWATAAPSTTVGADSVQSSNIVNGTITGADLATNIAITTTSNFVTSGTVTSNITTARDFRIYDSDANPNENYISLKAPASLPSNFEYTWPANFGTATHVLTTDGLGGLTWSAPASSSQWLNGPSSAIGYTAGAVGIGTTTPTPGYGLEVAGNVALWRVVGSNGGAAVPTYTTGSGNGMFSPNGGADLGFATNGTEKIRILVGGNVGIGMTAPSARLNIAAGTATGGTAPLKFTPGVLLGTEEDGAMEYTSAGLWFTIGSTRYLIPMNTTAGNYSNVQTIGNAAGSITVSPMAGNSLIVNSSTVSNSSTSGALIVSGGVGVTGAVNASGNISSGGTMSASTSVIAPQVYGSTAASGNIRIDGTSDPTKGNVLLASAGGSVGIGTTTPNSSYKLDVNGALNATSLYVGGVAVTSGSSQWITNGADIGYIGGRVGIGTTSPSRALVVSTTASSVTPPNLDSAAAAVFTSNTWTGIAINASNGASSFIHFGDQDQGRVGVIDYYHSDDSMRFYTNIGERVRITATGDVGIGLTNPGHKLGVDGSINITAGNALRFAGSSVCTSSGCTSSSDRRLKEDIRPLENSLEKLVQLEGVQYYYKDKVRFTERHQIGVIAQDVERVFPEVVITDAKTGEKAVAYDHLVAPMIEALKELRDENRELKERLKQIEEKLLMRETH